LRVEQTKGAAARWNRSMSLTHGIFAFSAGCWLFVAAAGCQSPYYADRGALAGGLVGTGVGALVGNAVGKTGPGALIGAGVGALTGTAIGSAMDDIEARNRAEIAAQLGRPVAAGHATIDEVVAMNRAGVSPPLIVNYVNNSGMAQPVTAQDVIVLTQQGVPSDVIQAMQTPRVALAPTAILDPPPGPVIIEEPPFPPPVFYHHHHCHPGPRFGWGISFSG
jgi:hypothetical protein